MIFFSIGFFSCRSIGPTESSGCYCSYRTAGDLEDRGFDPPRTLGTPLILCSILLNDGHIAGLCFI
jgi:hypothetical protein